jgi:ABC-type phosphate transport system substrate-binding protein
MPYRTSLFAALAILAIAATSTARSDGFRVVANPSVTVTTLSPNELSRLFLKKTTSWPDGQKAVVVDQERIAPVRSAFSLAVHHRDADAIASYWQTMVFSGRDTPPPVKTTDAAVLALVRATPGAVGYVSEATPLEGVKAIAVK